MVTASLNELLVHVSIADGWADLP